MTEIEVFKLFALTITKHVNPLFRPPVFVFQAGAWL